MYQVAIRPGDKHQITTENISCEAIVKQIRRYEGENQKGYLVSYEIDGYGETGDFFHSDGSIVQGQSDERRIRSGIPQEYVYKYASNFDWTVYGEDVEMQKKIANAFVTRFETFKKQGRGLYISSSTKGSGKTMLACCIANEILKYHDISVKFITIADYIELVKEKDGYSKDKIESILESSLLILDDIGVETASKDWIASAVYCLVDRRDKNLLPTIYTSNLKKDELKGEERIVNRIYGHAVEVYMPEVSIRKKKADKMNAEFIQEILKE